MTAREPLQILAKLELYRLPLCRLRSSILAERGRLTELERKIRGLEAVVDDPANHSQT